MQTTETRRPTLAAALLIVAGVLCALGGVLDWGSLTSGGEGITIKGGSVGIVLGVVSAGFGVAVFIVASRSVRIALGIIVIAGGGFLTLAGIAALTDDSVFARTAAQALLEGSGSPTDEASLDESETILVQGIEAGEIERKVDIGLYAFVAGSLLMLVGGVVTILTSRTGGASTVVSGSTPPPPAPLDTSPPTV